MEGDFNLLKTVIPLVRLLVPFLQLSGIFLNLFSIYVLRKGQKGPSLPTVHYYLTAALLWQTSALAGLFLQFIPAAIPSNLYKLRVALYQGLAYSYTVCNASRLWTMIAMTLDRFLALCSPLKHSVISTTSRAKRTLVGIFIAAAIFRIPDLIVTICLYPYEPDNHTRCDYYLDENRIQKKIIDTEWSAACDALDSILIYLAPRIIVVILSIKMFRQLANQFKVRRTYLLVDDHQSTKELEFDSLLLIIKSGVGSLLLAGLFASSLLLAMYSPEHSTVLMGIPLFAEITNMSLNFFIFLAFGRGFRSTCKEIVINGWRRTRIVIWSPLDDKSMTNERELTKSREKMGEELFKFLVK